MYLIELTLCEFEHQRDPSPPPPSLFLRLSSHNDLLFCASQREQARRRERKKFKFLSRDKQETAADIERRLKIVAARQQIHTKIIASGNNYNFRRRLQHDQSSSHTRTSGKIIAMEHNNEMAFISPCLPTCSCSSWCLHSPHTDGGFLLCDIKFYSHFRH
jgi:hypothetical protein